MPSARTKSLAFLAFVRATKRASTASSSTSRSTAFARVPPVVVQGVINPNSKLKCATGGAIGGAIQK
eukprot:1184115-Prorocentrum_minimum.AAC.3